MKKAFSAFLLLFFISKISAQETFPVNGTTNPRHLIYAITNATVYTDYKTSVKNATLLIRDGFIIDVGEKTPVPSGSIVYDLKGKNVYPSFIDMFSDYGLPEVKKPASSENPQFLSATKGAYNWNQSVRAEYDAYRNFSSDPKKAEELRKLGFGTVMSVNRDGIIRGSSVLSVLGYGKENELILKDRAASNFSFDRGSSTQDYPSSLMGAIALIRQTYYDAQWYSEGGYKKETNISLDAFNNLQDLPQVFETKDKQDEIRAWKIGVEFNKKYIIKGSGNEYERVNEIKETGSALIVPLNFPDALDLSDPFEAMNVSLRQLRSWDRAPSNLSMLESKQIEFALTLSDLKNKNDFWKNIRKAIDRGLSNEAALKALTYTPAKLLNIDSQAGQLKKGMLANFIICSGDLFEKDNAILENWVKGTPFRYIDPSTSDIRGNYTVRINDNEPLHLRIGGEILSPEVFVYEDTSPVKISYSRIGRSIVFQYELKKDFPKGIYRLSGNIDDSLKYLNGNVLLPSGAWDKWSATFDSVYVVPEVKNDTTNDVENVTVSFPEIAYGWKELPSSHSLIIRNATVWTNEADGVVANTDVYVVNGKISRVGKNLSVEANTESIDGTGKHLTSGIIDEHSHIAVSGNVNEATQASSAEVRIGDVIDAEDIQIYRQLAGGVTTAHLLHGSANPIGGQTQLIKLRWGQSQEKLKFENAPPFIKFALGENVKQSHWGDKQVIRFPQTRMGVEQVFIDYFTRAREYADARKKFLSGDPKNKTGKLAIRRQLELDALAEILEKKRFITCHSYEQSEINMLMHVADSFGFKVNTFTHILEGYKVAEKMKAHGVSGVSTFADWWAYKFEVYEAIPQNGAIMYKMGLNVSYNSDDPEMARRLNQEAAKAVKYGGISEEEAWKFVTLNPAKMLHIEERVGSIKTGKDADLVLWNDNPLSIYSYPLMTFVDGIKYFDIQRDSVMRIENRAEKARLMQKMTDAKSKGENTKKPGVHPQIINHCDGAEEIFIK